MKFTEISIAGRTYIVTETFAAAIVGICKEAEAAAAKIYPDSPAYIPVTIAAVGHRIISVIKVYRAFSGKNLRDSKTAIDKVRFGKGTLCLGNFPWDKAQEIAQSFREAGATVHTPSALELLAKASN